MQAKIGSVSWLFTPREPQSAYKARKETQGFGTDRSSRRSLTCFSTSNSPVFEEISISMWLAGNPAPLIADNFSIGKEEVGRLPKKVLGIIR